MRSALAIRPACLRGVPDYPQVFGIYQPGFKSARYHTSSPFPVAEKPIRVRGYDYPQLFGTSWSRSQQGCTDSLFVADELPKICPDRLYC